MFRRIAKPWFIWRPWQIALRMIRHAMNIQGGYRPLRTAWGTTIEVDPTKTIGHSIWTTGVYDLSVSESLARLIRPGDLVMDAGANVGYMSLLAAAAAGPTGRVLAYEPNPELFDVLRKNVGSAPDNYAPIQPYDVALGSSTGIAKLVLPSQLSGNDGLAYIGHSLAAADRCKEVAVKTIDGILEDRNVGLLKLDVEGFELEVLRGASRSLSESRIRDIVFEDHHGHDSAVCRLLRQYEYSIFSISWRLRGLRLAEIERGERSAPYEAQSFLATRSPQESLSRCESWGWRVLRKI